MSSKTPPKSPAKPPIAKATKAPMGKVTKLKSRAARTLSQRTWLLRQLNDPYVKSAKVDGYRSRAAYKLKELNDKYHVIKKNMNVVDLGAAPGGWSQIAAEIVGDGGTVVGIDLIAMDSMPGTIFIQGDFLELEVQERLKELLGGDQKVDVILSDMAAATTGHASTDHIRIIVLVEAAFAFSLDHLKIGGTFIAKVFQGGTEGSLLVQMKKNFSKVFHAKPQASRADSKEIYVVATGFKG